jgi:hypothetical protein
MTYEQIIFLGVMAALMFTAGIVYAMSVTQSVSAQCRTVTGTAGTVNQCTGATTSSSGASATGCVGGHRTLTSSDGRTLTQAC